MRRVAAELEVGFIMFLNPCRDEKSGPDLTINGSHLNDAGYQLLRWCIADFSSRMRGGVRGTQAGGQGKNRQFFRRYRFSIRFITGRSKSYGYLDFLPAMRNFEIMTANRDSRIWDLATGKNVPPN